MEESLIDYIHHASVDKFLSSHLSGDSAYSMPLYIIAMCQVNEASLIPDTLQLSQGNVNFVVRGYLSPTPVGVGVGL